MKANRQSLFFLPVILLIAAFYLYPTNERSFIQIAVHEKHRGVCWVGGPSMVDDTDLQQLAEKNVNWISQTPFGWQSGHDNPEIRNNHGLNDRVWWGESHDGLRKTTRMAKALGIKTILKPHIWLRDPEGKWRGEIRMNTEEDWRKWFADYEEFIIHYARLAEEEGMEMFCIGTELHNTCLDREEDWRQLIEKIRNVYSGELTYAANFADEYEDVPFWDALDYIGVQGYFQVSDDEQPRLEDVKMAWKTHLEVLQDFSNLHQKPILFTEIGYKSTKDAGISPWAWPERLTDEERKQIFSEETQATLYQAMMEETMNAPFVAGIHLWKWYPKYGQLRAGRRGNSTLFNIDFTPQGKQAEAVMSKYFGLFKN